MNQTKLRIAYLGPCGTYSEDAAIVYSQSFSGRLTPLPSISAVIRAVASDEADRGVVPIENSLEGSVNITLDTLAHDVELYIVREIVLPISHCLYGKRDEPIETIASHPQALAQCRHYLNDHYPDAIQKAVESTAIAATMVKEGKVSAAIAGSKAGVLYELIPRDVNIQDNASNFTRFIVLSRRPEPDATAKMSIVMRIQGDKPGSLCDILSEFAQRGVNLTRIESRPARTGLGDYIFFIDLDGTTRQTQVAEAIHAVAVKSQWLKNLGMYDIICPAER